MVYACDQGARRARPAPPRRPQTALAMRGALAACALAGTLAAAPAAAQPAAAPASAGARAWHIDAGPLGEALARFADQAGITLLYDPAAVRGRASAGLQGVYSVPDGLARLLDGSGLDARQRGAGTYVLQALPAGPVAQLAPVTIEADGVRADPAWARTATRRELDARQVLDWNDIGKRVDPGVNYNRRTKSINIRGLDENRVVTRIDGIRLPWLDDGARGIQGGLNAVDFNTLSRLDVVRGADSSAAGSGALGGLADLRTLEPADLLRDGRRFGALAKSDYDSADASWGLNAALAGQVHDDTSWLLQAGTRNGHDLDNRADTGGYGSKRSQPSPEDYAQNNFLLKLQQRIDGGHRLGLTGEYFKRRADLDQMYQQGAGTSYQYGANRTHEETTRKRVSLDYQYNAPQAGAAIDSARAMVYWQRLRLDSSQDAHRTRDGRAYARPGDPYFYGYPSGPYGRSNSIQESILGVNGELSSRFEGMVSQRVTIGGEWYGNRTEQYSDGYDNCPAIPPGTPAPMGPRLCDMLHTNQADMPRVKGSQWAIWAQDEIAFADGRYILTPSLRYDHYEQKPQQGGGYQNNPNAGTLPPPSSGGRFSPKLLGTWKAREALTLYAQYGFGYRAPSATELYTNYGGPGTYLRVGNPSLKPETSKGWELGARLGDDQLGGAVSLFDNRYQNFIDKNVPLGKGSPQWQPAWDGQYPLGVTGLANRARVRIYGAEASAHWRFAPNWRTWGSLAWAVGKDENTGQHLNSVPPLKAILGLGYQRDEWGIDAMLTAATRRDDVQYPEACASARYADFQAPGYGVVDLSAYWRPAAVKGLQLQAGVFNLFDKKYWEAINVPTAGAIAIPRPLDWYTEPGRSVRVSLTYQY